MPRSLFSHVDIAVSSLDVSLPFYRELLGHLGGGSESEVEGERGETIHYLSADELGGQLGLRARQSDAHGVPYERYAVGIHHIAFGARAREEVDAVARWARDRGAPIESGPAEYDYGPGYYAVFFHDPDGIKLEVVHTA